MNLAGHLDILLQQNETNEQQVFIIFEDIHYSVTDDLYLNRREFMFMVCFWMVLAGTGKTPALLNLHLKCSSYLCLSSTCLPSTPLHQWILNCMSVLSTRNQGAQT